MQIQNFQPKKIAPIQYILKKLNSDAGMVVPGWGTTPLMAVLMVLFFLFLLIIVQLFNASILLEGIDVDWSGLNSAIASADTPPSITNQFTPTAIGVFLGLLVLAFGCITFIVYGALTYPTDQP
jgi:photosystem II PsbH protein